MSSDTLSDLLRAVRLTGAAFFDIEASAPWAEMQPAGPTVASCVLPGVQHLISYHAVTEGTCFGGLIGGWCSTGCTRARARSVGPSSSVPSR